MKVFRFMSMDEFKKYQIGDTLSNNKNHHDYGQKTESVGFCFMDCDDYCPECAYEFLSGIVSDDVCVVFEVDESLLIKSSGTYAASLIDDDVSWFSTMDVDEYCCQSYDKNDFKLIAYCFNISWNNFNWIGEKI